MIRNFKLTLRIFSKEFQKHKLPEIKTAFLCKEKDYWKPAYIFPFRADWIEVDICRGVTRKKILRHFFKKRVCSIYTRKKPQAKDFINSDKFSVDWFKIPPLSILCIQKEFHVGKRNGQTKLKQKIYSVAYPKPFPFKSLDLSFVGWGFSKFSIWNCKNFSFWEGGANVEA